MNVESQELITNKYNLEEEKEKWRKIQWVKQIPPEQMSYKEKDKWSVYGHCSPSQKKYIGITCLTLNNRWRPDGYGYRKQVFYNAILKYGWDNITHCVFYQGINKEEAEFFEKELIKFFNSKENGYNCADGGKVNTGFHLSEEFKEKLRKIHTGKHHTEESKKRMSEAHSREKGYWYQKKIPQSAKDKIREKNKGNQYHAKKVAQKDLNGNIIKIWNSMEEAGKAFNVSPTNIGACCRGRQKTCKNFTWEYYNG